MRFRHISVALARYLRWYVDPVFDAPQAIPWIDQLIWTRLGVKTQVFHLGDYRREHLGPGQQIPDDYFFVNGMFCLQVVH